MERGESKVQPSLESGGERLLHDIHVTAFGDPLARLLRRRSSHEASPLHPSTLYTICSEVGSSPPWYVYDAKGKLCIPDSDVPERLLNHPELVQRGLASRLGDPLKPVR